MLVGAKGVTLVEMLIALLLASIAFTALAGVMVQSIATSANLTSQARLKDDLMAVATLMQLELGRAGYLAGVDQRMRLAEKVTNPFAAMMKISHHPKEETDTCIEYGYDINSNGNVDVTPQERLGFRLRNYAIEWRQKAARCEDGGWQDLSEAKHIRFSHLKFSTQRVHQQGRDIALVMVELVAQLKHKPDIQRHLQFSVRLTDYE